MDPKKLIFIVIIGLYAWASATFGESDRAVPKISSASALSGLDAVEAMRFANAWGAGQEDKVSSYVNTNAVCI